MSCPNFSRCKGKGNNKHKSHNALNNCPLNSNNDDSTTKRNDNVLLEEIRGKLNFFYKKSFKII